MPNRIDISHIAGQEDPRLWLPDQILGAYGDIAKGLEAAKKWASCWNQIMKSVEVAEINL